MTSLAWQDAVPRADRVRAVLDSVFHQPDYAWRERPDVWGPLRRGWYVLQQWLDGLHASHVVVYWLLLALLASVLALILSHAGVVAWRTMRADTGRDVTAPVRQVERRDAAWHRREAERLAADGRYVEAIQADFVRLLLELDARRLVRFHPSRTPNEYTREATLSPEARRRLQELVRRLYLFVFARRPCGPDDLLDWQSLAALDRYAGA